MTNEAHIKALDEMLTLLAWSTDGTYARKTVQDLSSQVEAVKCDLNLGQPLRNTSISVLIAPTGDLQETAMENGWGDAFLRLANVLDP